MISYFILLTIVIILAFLAENAKDNTKIYNFYVIIIFLGLVLFAGFRDLTIGSDTNAYVSRFESLSLDFFGLMNQNTRIELGYRLIEYVALLISKKYIAVLITTAFFAVYFQLKGIYKVSVMPIISIFVFITFGIYTFVFNGARQGIAAAIYLFAIYYLVKGNFKRYALWVLVAFLFHKSVIVALPLYFIFRRKFNLKLLIVYGIGLVFMIASFKVLIAYMGLVSEQYAKYQNFDFQGGLYLTLAYTLLSVFFILFRHKIKLKDKISYNIFLQMFLIGTFIYLVVFFTGAYIEMTRIGFYFILSALFIWPVIFKNLKQKEIILPFIIFVTVHLTFFYMLLSDIANLTPYIFNTQIFN